LRFEGKAARVQRFPNYATAGESTVELSAELGAGVGDDVEVWRERPALWRPMGTWRAKYVEELETAWIAEAVVDLKRSNATDGMMAWPMAPDGQGNSGSFLVEAKNADGLRYDVTDLVMAGFPGRGSTARLRIVYESGTYKTRVDLTGLGGSSYRVKYLMEAVNQASPPTDSWRGPMMSCIHSVRDWSARLGLSGLDGTVVDTYGGHWFCDRRNEAGVLLSGFSEWCMQTECPYFELMRPWAIGISDVAGLFVSRGGRWRFPPELYGFGVVAKDGNNSIFELAGMPGYTGGNTAEEGVTWFSGAREEGDRGVLGLIENTPTAEKETDEGEVKRVRYGALGSAGDAESGGLHYDGSEGVFGSGAAFDKLDRLGGVGPAGQDLFDDRSGLLEEETYSPLRRAPDVSMARTHGWGGPSESQVQRSRSVPVRLNEIEVGVDGSVPEGHSWEWQPDGSLRIQLVALD
jgi:hypothetical protein